MTNRKTTFNFIDLFAGIGGFHHALESLGGQCVLACELDEECRRVYSQSFTDLPSDKLVANIRSITREDVDDENSSRSEAAIAESVPDHDILCAGFPCQPFSKSGFQQGVRDKTRGTLFFDILQIIRAKRPTYLFLENVRNLAGPRHKDTWRTIIAALREEGYHVSDKPLVMTPHLIPPELGGAPQVRDRVFILGVRGDASGAVERVHEAAKRARRKELWNPDDWDVRDYLLSDEEIPNLEKYLVSGDEETYLDAWEFFVREIPRDNLPGFPIWAFAFLEEPELDDSMADWDRDFRIKNSLFFNENRSFIEEWMSKKWGPKQLAVGDFPFSRQKFEWQARKRHPDRNGRTLRDLVAQFRPSGIRVKPPTYLPALVAITQTSVVGPALRGGGEHFRRLTPLEAARLQGMPEEAYRKNLVDDPAAYKQLGNAVNVGLVRFVCGILMDLNQPLGRVWTQPELPFASGFGSGQ